jgi:hypothetical protein
LGSDYPKEERIVREGEAVRMSGRGGMGSPEIVRIIGGRRLGFRSPEESHCNLPFVSNNIFTRCQWTTQTPQMIITFEMRATVKFSSKDHETNLLRRHREGENPITQKRHIQGSTEPSSCCLKIQRGRFFI